MLAVNFLHEEHVNKKAQEIQESSCGDAFAVNKNAGPLEPHAGGPVARITAGAFAPNSHGSSGD